MTYTAFTEIITELKDTEGSSFPFDAKAFAEAAYKLLEGSKFQSSDIWKWLKDSWDFDGCLPHPVDTDTPPFLIDIHTERHWSLRATLWPPEDKAAWRDVFHSHFGYIVSKAITPIAYTEQRLKTFGGYPNDIVNIPFSANMVHFITPESIHKVLLPTHHWGISLSVRTRAVRTVSHEINEETGEILERTKSARDRFTAIGKLFEESANHFG